MILKDSGTVQVNGYNVRRTDDNQWLISKASVMIGYVDTLAEVYPAIDYHVANVRARAAKAEADATQARERASWEDTLLDFTDAPSEEDDGESLADEDAAYKAVESHIEAQKKLDDESFLHLGGGDIMSF